MTTAVDVDLRIDLNTMDETGLPWTFLDQAPDPSRIIPGRHIVVGSGAALAVAVVVDITDEGIDHVWPLKGSVASNARFLENSSCIAASARSSARSGRSERHGPGRDGITEDRNPRKHWAEGHSAAPAVTKLVRLITRRSQVQILPPPPM